MKEVCMYFAYIAVNKHRKISNSSMKYDSNTRVLLNYIEGQCKYDIQYNMYGDNTISKLNMRFDILIIIGNT